ELSADELPPEFAQFGTTAIMPKGDAVAAPQEEIPALVTTAILPRLELEAPAEIAGIDFSSLSAVAGSITAQPSAEIPMSPLDDFDFDFPPPDIAGTASTRPAPLAAMPDPEPEPELLMPEADPEPTISRDEQVKVIGTLRIGIPLYNVYLNEADEWSRRLATEISEWALQMEERVADSTVGWAHALAGSSATVGFQALSHIARALAGALQHTHTLACGTPEHARTFTVAAEEVRRLLHQFAAGFLKDPDARLLRELQA